VREDVTRAVMRIVHIAPDVSLVEEVRPLDGK
jgi:hypothetical protein